MTAGKKLFRVQVKEAPTRELRDGRGLSRLLIDPSAAGTDVIDIHLNELNSDSGSGPRHYHEQADNIYWVLQGSIEVTLADEVLVLEEDELVLIPPGVVHETSNPGTKVARFIEIYVPAGEDFHIVDSFNYER